MISSYNKPKLGREYTGEPPVSDHPKSKDLVVACGRWSFTRVEPQGASNKKRFELIYFMEDKYCIQFLSYAMCSSILLLKFFVYRKIPKVIPSMYKPLQI